MARSILFCIMMFASLWQVAGACSCRPGQTLEQRYQRADHVLIAKIFGCAPGRLSADGLCDAHSWTFETIENLKGTDARVSTERFDPNAAVNSCDISLKVGETYLLFLKDGRTDLCSGTATLSGEIGARKQADIEVLRAYRDGAITRIVDPWYFQDSGWHCGIDHLLDGGVVMSFAYSYGQNPLSDHYPNPRPTPIPTMTLRLPVAATLAGPMQIEIGGETISPIRKDIPLGQGRTLSLDTLQGDAALATLDKLVKSSELVVTGTRTAFGGEAQPFRATTNTTQLAGAAAKFKACLAAHPVSTQY